MTDSQVLVGALTMALLSPAVVPAAVGPEALQSPQGQEIQLAEIALEQPGADHRLGRENAVQDLLGMTVQAAHSLLQKKLAAGIDEEKVSLYILDELERRISNPNDPVFGLSSAGAGRALLKSYVPSLVSAFMDVRPTADLHRPLREPALKCLRAMEARERLEGLSAILVPAPGGIEDLEMQKAALRAAAQCRETGLAPLMSGQLGDGELDSLARQSLEKLTFQNFRDRFQFQVWWAQNREKTYLELVEIQARTAAERQRALNDRLVQLTVQLVESLVEQSDAVKWREIHNHVLADDPPGTALACLRKLREILVDNPHEGNASEQRLEFHHALVQRVGEAADTDEKVLLLETAAYLIRPQGEVERAAMEVLLIEHLEGPDHALRLAALRGLMRFPSASNRAAVVAIAEDALVAAGGEEMETLETALRTLRGRAWHAPTREDADHNDWLRVLRQIFSRTDAPELLQQGLAVALLEDAAGVQASEVFALLLDLAKNSQIEIGFRNRVLLQLPRFATPENGHRYVGMVLALLDDESSAIRAQAARMLTNLPSGTSDEQEDWDQQVLTRLRERILREPRLEVFQALVEGLSELGQQAQEQENVIGIFKDAIESLPEHFADQRSIVIERLAQLALDPGLEVGLWQVAARVLLDQGQRDEALSILNKHKAADLADRNGVEPHEVQAGLELVIQAALLKPADGRPHSEQEAHMVLGAFVTLDVAFAAPREDPAARVLRLRLHDVLGNDSHIIELGGRYITDEEQPLSADQGDQVLMLMARASLRQNEPFEAWNTAQRVSELGRHRAEGLTLCQNIARAFLTVEPSTPSKAVEVLTEVVAYTQQQAPQFRDRFLDLAYAKLQASTTSHKEVAQMLADKRRLFDADDCPPAARQRYEQLVIFAGS